MRMVDIILKKRSGDALSREEIRFFVEGFTKGDIPDYQAAALMMAVYFRGMNRTETVSLVDAMLHSGDVIDLSGIRGVKIDKHSTGGVGDKTSLVVGPIAAAAGVPVAKMTGRGLGHTGGTIDKLESFRGFSIEISDEQFKQQVNRIGIAFCGQTANLVPADKKLYALRDVTGTVENISLIAGSIMSKKLAGGADAIVLDVKTGSGAFMKTREDAFALAKEMVEIGKQMGKRVSAILTNMDQPLGYAVGNALEVKEAIAALNGEGPADLMELSLHIASAMIRMGLNISDAQESREIALQQIRSRAALDKLAQLIDAQGGDSEQVKRPALLPMASMVIPLKAGTSGFIQRIQADEIGLAAMLSGAGRSKKEDVIDHAAGVVLRKKNGDPVKAGEVIAEIHSNREEPVSEALDRVKNAMCIGVEVPNPLPLIIGSVD